MSWLNGLRLALWKEWRDHRAMLIALTVALPGLTALGFWAFADRLGGASPSGQALVIVPVALGLVLFAIAGDLVAGEHRRGTMDVLRRVPGARSQAFAAKWLVLFATMVGATLWLALSWLLGWNVLAEAEQAYALEFMLGEFPTGPFWQLFWLGAVVCSWAFVVAHWLARSGAAAIASVLVLGLLLAPVAWIFWTHPYFMPFGPVHAPAIALVMIAAAMGVSALSWFVGLRFHGAFWRPGLLGLAAVIALSGVGYAYTSHELDEWTDIDPNHDAFRIRQAYVSPNGKRLYLNVNRGEPWGAGRPVNGHNLSRAEWFRLRGTPIQTWIVDLETGHVTRDAEDGEHAFTIRPGGLYWSLPANVCAPSGVVGRSHFNRSGVMEIRWLDADSGDVIATLAPDLTSGPVEAAIRKDLRRFGSRLDRQGRRAWLRSGEVEREGQLLALPPRPTKRAFGVHAMEVPGGWRTWLRDPESGRYTQAFLDLETGEARAIENDAWRPSTQSCISPKLALKTKHANRKVVAMTIVDAITAEAIQEVRNLPAENLGPVGGDRMLCLRNLAGRDHAAHVWNPMTGESIPVVFSHPVPMAHFWASIRSRLPDGRLLLELGQRRQSADPAEFWQAFAALDAQTGEAEVLMEAHHRDRYGQPLTVEAGDSFLVLEGGKRIVRYRGPGNREVVWPKAE